MKIPTYRLLAEDEPAPFAIEHEHAASPFFLTCDHGDRRLPRKLGDLGLPAAEFERHIAWDIGAAAVTSLLADALDAGDDTQI